MNFMKKIKLSLAVFLSIVVFGFASTGVFASEEVETKTCVGSYGQTTVCNYTTKEVVYQDNVELAPTALDTPTFLVAIATMTSGVGAFILKKKIA